MDGRFFHGRGRLVRNLVVFDRLHQRGIVQNTNDQFLERRWNVIPTHGRDVMNGNVVRGRELCCSVEKHASARVIAVRLPQIDLVANEQRFDVGFAFQAQLRMPVVFDAFERVDLR